MLRKLSVAVEQSPASVVITDLEACIQYVNRRFSEVTGYDANEAIGQNPRLLQSGETGQEVYRELWSKLANGQTWKGELLNKRKNGELYWEESQVAPVRDDSGAVTHYVAVKTDITQRKQAEAALHQSHEALRSILDTTLDGFGEPIGKAICSTSIRPIVGNRVTREKNCSGCKLAISM